MSTSDRKLFMHKADQDRDWPEPVKRAFIEFCQLADQHEFNVLCAVGFPMKDARAGQLRLNSFFSPRASGNPDLSGMCDDIAELFEKMSLRLKQ